MSAPVPVPVPLSEAELATLIALRQRLESRLAWERDQVERVAARIYCYNMGESRLATELIDNAEAVCEVLAPFVKRREP